MAQQYREQKDVEEDKKIIKEAVFKCAKSECEVKSLSDKGTRMGSEWRNNDVGRMNAENQRIYQLQQQSKNVYMYDSYQSAITVAKQVVRIAKREKMDQWWGENSLKFAKKVKKCF